MDGGTEYLLSFNYKLTKHSRQVLWKLQVQPLGGFALKTVQ